MRDNKGRFIKGSQVGEEHRFKKGEHRSTATEFRKGEVSGEKHPYWKGDNAGYHVMHKWIAKTLGKPSLCEKCGTREAKRFDWANISGEYRRDISDWKRLCVKCHNNEHKNWEVRWGFA